MSLILQIDTTTEICSASLAHDGKVLLEKVARGSNKHASLLAVFIAQLLAETETDIAQIDAVALSHGPGSYTGLRIGASVAKGICYAADKPLLSVSTLAAMADIAAERINDDAATLFPLIDARRMDAYFAIFDSSRNRLTPDNFCTLEEATLTLWKKLYGNRLYFFGNASYKISPLLINSIGTIIENVETLSRNVSKLAMQLYEDKKFAELAYYEPVYLKHFEGHITN